MATAFHACPVCSSSGPFSRLCAVDEFTVYVCTACHAEHIWPLPTDQQLKAYYDRAAWFEGGEKGGYVNYDSQAGWCSDLVTSILESFPEPRGRSFLDFGCAYGIHLAAAAQRGWNCFGVEVSDHARHIAQQRLGKSAHIVESVAHLHARKFDLIFLLDVVEHLPSPYLTLHELFSLGAIAPETTIVITTPNAGSTEALRDPAGWTYRHPPSHLVYYTADALTYLLRRLRFRDVEVSGLSPAEYAGGDLSRSAGLIAIAKGNDLPVFMYPHNVANAIDPANQFH